MTPMSIKTAIITEIHCVDGTVQLNSTQTGHSNVESCVFTDFFRVTHQHSRVFRMQLMRLVTARQFTHNR